MEARVVWCPPPPGGSILSPPEVGGSLRSPALGQGVGGALRHHTHPSQTLAPHPATSEGDAHPLNPECPGPPTCLPGSR